ncbi:Vacuolar protein sorting 29 [Giardia muris]|uniref:Vacuolar protein sorting-associated protein 29 n=1 Tax=Giardia muris TaxID=5742 RepID=A0A4Z1T737_GIAMU|nr:Vacuolar protein sorting 29 [Giardia muris]|eukprot:TNJ29883.1 Vacuolar protein sorting 29 [Giardia muris]
MQHILVIGDVNIPYRAFQIPVQFRELFHPRRINHIVVTGNVTSAGVISFLKTIKTDLHAVRGPYDETSYPEFETRHYLGYNITVMNGHQCIPLGNSRQAAAFGKVYDSDIVCCGCSYKPFAGIVDNVLIIKPGSLTGSIADQELGYSNDDDLISVSKSQAGDSAESLIDQEGGHTFVPRPGKVYPSIPYLNTPSFILLGISRTDPMISVFTYYIQDAKLVVKSEKFLLPRRNLTHDPRVEMLAQPPYQQSYANQQQFPIQGQMSAGMQPYATYPIVSGYPAQ